MKVWILAKKVNFNNYGNKRFKEVAKDMGIELKIFDPKDFDLIVTKEGKKSILHKGHTVDLPDCLIPRMGAHTTYFALAVIRQLERAGVFVLNSSNSIEVAKDKLAALQILSSANVPIPKTMLAKFPLNIDTVEKEFTNLLVLKTLQSLWNIQWIQRLILLFKNLFLQVRGRIYVSLS